MGFLFSNSCLNEAISALQILGYNKKEIEKLAHDKFGNLAGIAQQYLFYWKRENGKSA